MRQVITSDWLSIDTFAPRNTTLTHARFRTPGGLCPRQAWPEQPLQDPGSVLSAPGVATWLPDCLMGSVRRVEQSSILCEGLFDNEQRKSLFPVSRAFSG